ncbi:extracellular solute-binding protein [Microbacterium sp. zg.Y1090]|uniref:extracellular solute-binding protein n=1 Tax=Microbacterium TaxID=33882 RepID=UPI00214CD502|nr:MULTISPECIES: extracellular solute-binding protein [unclassified Microbacterium]MCR2814046.1 extracellular solute-binding protein [Microbacterium sp. zg.Y1084]MCR2817949.1 extracellular solute-binding protein [Microbacterium sp. zg.Y1090]MDL5487803.1 extracellular solute-binding protein [Microbacterium sp. zg-Y1211]WIM27886.1 extracellular solute-binding protein [Microbacterium sp. zg-Y1090]
MRRILITAGAMAGILTLAACSGGGGGGEAGDLEGRGDITIWYSNNEAEIAWGEQMVEAWNADHPDEQVKAQEIPAGASSEEVIGAAITAGNAPCLIFNTSPAAVPQFQKQGGLVNLSEFEDGDDYIVERSGDIAEQYRSEDGGFYQLPWKANPVMIFYNKDLFSQAGLDPEAPALSTYDEFLDTARTLTEAGVAPYAINPAPTSEFFQSWFDFYPLYAAQTGGTQLVEEGEATFDSDDAVAVAEFWRTMYDEGLAGREQYQGDAFADAQAAMSIVGPWAIAVYGDDVNWGSVPVPTEGGTDAAQTWTFSDAKNVGMFTACENKGTAWDVLKFATSADQDGIWLEETGQMPLRDNLTEEFADYFDANPAYAAFGEQAARTVEVPNVPNSVEIWQAFRDGYSEAVIFGETDVDTFLSDTATRVNELAAGS